MGKGKVKALLVWMLALVLKASQHSGRALEKCLGREWPERANSWVLKENWIKPWDFCATLRISNYLFVVAHTFNPSNLGSRGRWISMSSRSVWSTHWVSGTVTPASKKKTIEIKQNIPNQRFFPIPCSSQLHKHVKGDIVICATGIYKHVPDSGLSKDFPFFS